jgi:hypothetical protein
LISLRMLRIPKVNLCFALIAKLNLLKKDS